MTSSLALVQLPTKVGFISDVDDFDGVADETTVTPASIIFDEDTWQKRQPVKQVKSVLSTRLTIKVREISTLFLPIWRVRYQKKDASQIRVILLEALTGQALEF